MSRPRSHTSRSPSSKASDPQAALRPILENPAIEKVGQNLKYDMVVLANVGMKLAGASWFTRETALPGGSGPAAAWLVALAPTALADDAVAVLRWTALLGFVAAVALLTLGRRRTRSTAAAEPAR